MSTAARPDDGPSTGSVLLVCGPARGGIRRHVEALAAGLRGRGWRVAVAGPGVADLSLPAGVDRLELRVARGSFPQALRALWQLSRRVRGYDVVHAHGTTAGWFVATAARLGRRSDVAHRPRLVVSVHNLVGEGGTDVSGRLAGAVEGALPSWVDATIAVAPPVARRFTGSRHARRVRVVPPVIEAPHPRTAPADTRRRLGVDAGALLVVCVARLHRQKDLPTLLAASGVLSERLSGLRVLVVGDGPDRHDLEDLLARSGLGGVVRLLGRRDDVADLLLAADVVVSSARWESVGLGVLEALHLGRPVVTTAVGVAPDVIRPTCAGWLVPVGRADLLADALGEALRDPAEAAARGGRATAAARPWFDAERLLSAVEDTYLEVLHAARGAAGSKARS